MTLHPQRNWDLWEEEGGDSTKDRQIDRQIYGDR